MKKIIGILILSFLWLSNANAGVKEPGKISNMMCTLSGVDAYIQVQEYLKKNPKKNAVVYLSCEDTRYEWNWSQGKKLESIHKKSFKTCTKNAKTRGLDECFLFSVNDKIVWEANDYVKKQIQKKLNQEKPENKNKEHDPEKYTFDGSYRLEANSDGFVKYKEQSKLTYKNPEDDIPGRFLYDQEDVTDDYQLHAIYVLASDSKDKQLDIKGSIEKIVLKGNKVLKNKTKEKQFRLDLTKEGKLDVSFLRVDKTKKQINSGDAATYLMGMAVKNGFYHPKKIYTIFYQDSYKREWGQVGDVKLFLELGVHVEIVGGVTYLGGDSLSNAWIPHLHELFHALGFVQLCAPGAVTERDSRWGKNDHLSYGNDMMSDRGGDTKNIDKKRKEYYGHSNADCPLDLRKSAFLEPTEEDFQLQPYIKSCATSRWVNKYDHQQALACLSKLDF